MVRRICRSHIPCSEASVPAVRYYPGLGVTGGNCPLRLTKPSRAVRPGLRMNAAYAQRKPSPYTSEGSCIIRCCAASKLGFRRAEQLDWTADVPGPRCATSAPGLGLAPATSAPGLRSSMLYLHRDCARPCHIFTGTGLTLSHICTGTGPSQATSAPGLRERVTKHALRRCTRVLVRRAASRR